jgi:hypothetical protein
MLIYANVWLSEDTYDLIDDASARSPTAAVSERATNSALVPEGGTIARLPGAILNCPAM